jgi:hypothetical protein
MIRTEDTIALVKDIKEAIEIIGTLTADLIVASRKHSSAKATLEDNSAAAILEGQIVGKNEEERKAARRTLLLDIIRQEDVAAMRVSEIEVAIRFQRDRLAGLRAIANLIASLGGEK